MTHLLLRGALAGAAGTTALHAATYLDMALRGRPASRTPEQTIDRLAHLLRMPVPGDGARRDDRLTGLGALGGIVVGVAVGVAYAAATRVTGVPGGVPAVLGVGAGAMTAANLPMTALGVTDPRSWSVADWLSDLLPHAAYATVTAATFAATDR